MIVFCLFVCSSTDKQKNLFLYIFHDFIIVCHRFISLRDVFHRGRQSIGSNILINDEEGLTKKGISKKKDDHETHIEMKDV